MDSSSQKDLDQTSDVESGKPSSKRKFLKWGAILLFLILSVFGFGWLTEYIVGDVIRAQVEEKSNGKYTISYEDLEFDWSTISVKLKDFTYEPLHPEKQSEVNDFTFGAHEVDVQLENLRGIYFEKALHIVQVKIESPEIEIIQKKKPERRVTFSWRTGNLYKLVQGFIKSYQVDYFEVNHLKMDYVQDYNGTPKKFSINDLSLGINNIHIDSTALAKNNNIFFTESIELKIKDQNLSIGDQLHHLHFDSLNLSTSTNSIEIYNSVLDTNQNAESQQNYQTFNQYDLHVPYVGITGLDFSKAYVDNILDIDSILLSAPDLDARVHLRDPKPSAKPKVDNRALKVLLDIFDEIHLNTFHIDDAQLRAVYGPNDTAKISGLNLDFADFVLDSGDLNTKEFYPDFSGLEVSINQPAFDLPGGNLLEANVLSFSTYDSILEIDQAVLTGKKRGDNERTKVKIAALKMTGVDPQEIIKDKKINLESVWVLTPELQIINKGNRNEISAFDIADFIHGDFKDYRIKKVNIEQGKVQILTSQNKLSNHKIGQFDIQLDHFALNEESIRKDRFLWSRNARLNLRDVHLYLAKGQHGLNAKKVKINTVNGHILALNLDVKPIVKDSSRLKTLAEIEANTFEVKGINFHRLKKIKKIDLSLLHMHDVKAKINHLAVDSIQNDSSQTFVDFLVSLESIDLDNVDIHDVDVLLQRKGVSVAKFSDGFLQTHKLSAREDKLRNGKLSFLSDSITYGLHRVMIPFTEKSHMLTIEDLKRRHDSTLEISGVTVRPIPGKKISDSAMSMVSFIPKITIENFHTFENRYSDTLHVGDVVLDKPMFRLTMPKEKKKRTEKFELPRSLSTTFMNGDVFAIEVESFDVQNGRITMLQNETKVSVNKLNLRSWDWMISQESDWTPDRFLWANDFSLDLSQLEYKIPGFEYCHHIDSLSYKFRPNSLKVHGVYYNNWKQNGVIENSQVSIYLPFIDFQNPNIYGYLKESKIEIDQIVASHGMVEADWYRKQYQSKKPFQLPTKIPDDFGGVNQIEVHHVSMNQMDVQMRIHNNNFVAPLEMDHFNLEVDSFHVTPGEQIDSNRVLWTNDIHVDVENIYTTVDEGLYELGADGFQFSTQSKDLELKGLSFVPTVGRYEYALHKGYQKDVFNISLKSLKARDLDYLGLIYNQKVKGGELNVIQPSVAILKDKRIPEPPYQYKAIIPEKFKQLKMPITLDSIIVERAKIAYEEFPEKGRKPGSILLTEMNITANNVTNDTAMLLKDSTLMITMDSRFLDTSDLTLYLEYNMLSPINSFKMSSTLGSFDATMINRYVEPVYSATINSGMVSRMDMSVIGNDSIAGGKMGLYYDDFKFTFLNEITHENKGFATKLRSMIGNTIIKSKNKYHPFKRRQPLYFQRITGKGWINYLVRIELAGVSSSVGLKNYRKDLKKANKKLWKEFDQNDKAERKQLAKQYKKRQKAKNGKN
ncbi:hypothetical protein KFE94_16925 [bacterium SCSIO 12643]|nr:hypothetical protein KFE94_16925 [bacterium SCSIO 12643]